MLTIYKLAERAKNWKCFLQERKVKKIFTKHISTEINV